MWDEGDLLRAAGTINAILDDGQLHLWRECIDECRHLTRGNWWKASDLAYQALTAYVGQSCIWTGRQGRRKIGFAPSTDSDEQVPCPTCGAPPNHRCRKLSARGKPKLHPHEARELAAREARRWHSTRSPSTSTTAGGKPAEQARSSGPSRTPP